MRIRSLIVWTVPCLALLAACTGIPLAGQRSEPPKPVHSVCNIATVSPSGKTQETLKKGGIVVSVSTIPFTPTVVSKKSYRQLPTLLLLNDRHNYEITTVPSLAASPAFLQFKIRILNQTDDVIRLSGVLARFNMDGKDYALDAESSGIRSLVDGVLAPQEQRDFDLYAAPADKLKDSSNVSLRLYAIPTGTKEKGNFEWNYRITLRQEAKELEATVETQALNPLEVQAIQQTEMIEQIQHQQTPQPGKKTL